VPRFTYFLISFQEVLLSHLCSNISDIAYDTRNSLYSWKVGVETYSLEICLYLHIAGECAVTDFTWKQRDCVKWYVTAMSVVILVNIAAATSHWRTLALQYHRKACCNLIQVGSFQGSCSLEFGLSKQSKCLSYAVGQSILKGARGCNITVSLVMNVRTCSAITQWNDDYYSVL
jgi:hypothetical protein